MSFGRANMTKVSATTLKTAMIKGAEVYLIEYE